MTCIHMNEALVDKYSTQSNSISLDAFEHMHPPDQYQYCNGYVEVLRMLSILGSSTTLACHHWQGAC